MKTTEERISIAISREKKELLVKFLKQDYKKITGFLMEHIDNYIKEKQDKK